MTQNEVEKLAELARLRFREKELRTMASQLGELLDFMGGLPRSSVSEDQKLSHQTLDLLRRDDVEPSLLQEEALKNAGFTGDGFFYALHVLKKEDEVW